MNLYEIFKPELRKYIVVKVEEGNLGKETTYTKNIIGLAKKYHFTRIEEGCADASPHYHKL